MHSEQRSLCIIDQANSFFIELNYPPSRFQRRERAAVVAVRQTLPCPLLTSSVQMLLLRLFMEPSNLRAFPE